MLCNDWILVFDFHGSSQCQHKYYAAGVEDLLMTWRYDRPISVEIVRLGPGCYISGRLPSRHKLKLTASGCHARRPTKQQIGCRLTDSPRSGYESRRGVTDSCHATSCIPSGPYSRAFLEQAHAVVKVIIASPLHAARTQRRVAQDEHNSAASTPVASRCQHEAA